MWSFDSSLRWVKDKWNTRSGPGWRDELRSIKKPANQHDGFWLEITPYLGHLIFLFSQVCREGSQMFDHSMKLRGQLRGRGGDGVPRLFTLNGRDFLTPFHSRCSWSWGFQNRIRALITRRSDIVKWCFDFNKHVVCNRKINARIQQFLFPANLIWFNLTNQVCARAVFEKKLNISISQMFFAEINEEKWDETYSLLFGLSQPIDFLLKEICRKKLLAPKVMFFSLK